MKRILVTGASGLLATELINSYLLGGDYELVLLSSNHQHLHQLYRNNNVSCISLDDFVRMDPLQHAFDIVIHTAFARAGNGLDYSNSLQYLYTLLQKIKQNPKCTFINISSQSVYGNASLPLWRENAPLGPNDLYAMAKVASENMVRLAFAKTDTNWTNIRLSSLCENARFLKVFVQNAIEGKPISLIGGHQMFSFLDVRDAASAVNTLIEESNTKFLESYNIGTGLQNSLYQIAEIVKNIGESRYGLKISIERTPADIEQNIGMDNTLFKTSFGWSPSYDMAQMIESLYEMLLSPKDGKYPISFKIKYSL